MSTSFLLEQDVRRSLHEVAQQLRVDSVRCSATASSGHPTSSMSAADLMAVLLARHLRYDFAQPKAPGNDHLIFSKGHASPLLYSMFKAAGAISDEELMTLRKFGSRLEGHPTPVLPWVDVATGSLGQGLPIGVGIALSGAYLCLIGLIGLALGVIIRHGAAAITALVGLVFVAPLAGLAMTPAGKFLPELIFANSLGATRPVQGFTLSPWAGLAIIGAYAVALLAVGGWLLARRDA